MLDLLLVIIPGKDSDYLIEMNKCSTFALFLLLQLICGTHGTANAVTEMMLSAVRVLNKSLCPG